MSLARLVWPRPRLLAAAATRVGGVSVLILARLVETWGDRARAASLASNGRGAGGGPAAFRFLGFSVPEVPRTGQPIGQTKFG